MRRKVTVVGAGNVGATCAQVLAAHDYANVVLVDIKEGLPQGKALDINQMGAVLGYEPRVTGSNSYEETAGSEVVVITAGLPRSPGMSRDDLVATNEKIVKDVTEKTIARSPEAILIDPRKKALFERLCEQEDLTSSQVVRRMIRAYVEERLGRPWVPGEEDPTSDGPSAGRRSEYSGWPGSSTPRASRPSSPGRRRRPSRTSQPWSSEATVIRWCRSSARPR